MSRLDSIEIFVRVVDCGSFSAAAEQLGVSKAHVSRQVAKLEGRLGCQLLKRTTRTLVMTETGQSFYMHCRQMISALDELEQSVIDEQDYAQGQLRIAVAGAFGERYIAPAAIEFMKLYPRLNVDLRFDNRMVDLISEGYDIAIRSGTMKDSSLIARRIASRKLYVCASPEFLAQNGTPQTPRSLRDFNCLIGSVQSWSFQGSDKQNIDIKIDGNWRCNNGYALAQAAIQGLGITQLPEFYVKDAIKSGQLVTVLDSFRPTDNYIWAVYPNNRHLSVKIRLFIDFLVERFDKLTEL